MGGGGGGGGRGVKGVEVSLEAGGVYSAAMLSLPLSQTYWLLGYVYHDRADCNIPVNMSLRPPSYSC